MPIFSGLMFFNEQEISDSGPTARIPSRRTCTQICTSWKNSSTSAGFLPTNHGCFTIQRWKMSHPTWDWPSSASHGRSLNKHLLDRAATDGDRYGSSTGWLAECGCDKWQCCQVGLPGTRPLTLSVQIYISFLLSPHNALYRKRH